MKASSPQVLHQPHGNHLQNESDETELFWDGCVDEQPVLLGHKPTAPQAVQGHIPSLKVVQASPAQPWTTTWIGSSRQTHPTPPALPVSNLSNILRLCTTASIPDRMLKVVREGDLRGGKRSLQSDKDFLLWPISTSVATN